MFCYFPNICRHLTHFDQIGSQVTILDNNITALDYVMILFPEVVEFKGPLKGHALMD